MARVSRKSASMVALALILSVSSAYAQECTSQCGNDGGSIRNDGGSIRDARNERANNQRDPIISEPTEVEEFVFVAPPLFQLPASNSPVSRGSSGQIRSSWAVGVFR